MGTTHESTAVPRALPSDTDPAPPDRSGTTPRTGPGAFLGELLLGGAYACLLSVALQLVVARLPVSDPGTYVPEALVAVAAAVLFGLAYGLPRMERIRRLPRAAKLVSAWTALSTLATLVLALPLHATRFYLGGASVDNTFRLQYLERAASTLALRDMNYVDLPPYYPAGWFWLGGRVANLLGLSGWEAYKPYAITWCALTAVVAFALYRLVLRGRSAFYAALVTVLAGIATAGVGEPYAWPTTAWLPPIAVLTWTALRRRDRPPWWVLVLIGVYLGLCGMTYTLHLGFGALLVVVLAALATAFAVREGRRIGPALAGAAGRVAVIAVV
ncbi:arabinofuranosyltransferase, partial [Saccharomonospora saliphila]|uniref:arabinofuranosyltransferase n=1 Tax=Saccharomonospora saliphila TaxID=369829 RepID=UPI000377E9FF